MRARQNELTVRLIGKADEISARSFLLVLRETVHALEAMERREPGERPSKWCITRASKNSPITVAIASDVDEPVTSRFVFAVRTFDSEARMPADVPEPAVQRIRNAVRALNSGVLSLEFESEAGEKATATPRVAANIDELLGGRTYRERTTLRGVLETLTVRDDGQLFFIRDRVRGRNVRCVIDSVEVLELAKQALGSRVSVWGMAKFNKLGLPISIKVEDFRVLPKDSPRFDEVPGIDLTGGMDAAEYVRRLRDGE